MFSRNVELAVRRRIRVVFVKGLSTAFEYFWVSRDDGNWVGGYQVVVYALPFPFTRLEILLPVFYCGMDVYFYEKHVECGDCRYSFSCSLLDCECL